MSFLLLYDDAASSFGSCCKSMPIAQRETTNLEQALNTLFRNIITRCVLSVDLVRLWAISLLLFVALLSMPLTSSIP